MTNDKEDFEKKFKKGIRNISVAQYNDKGVNVGFKPLHEEVWNYCEAYANQQRKVERKKNLTECIRLRKSLKGVGGETELLATAIVNQIMRYIKLSSNTNKDD